MILALATASTVGVDQLATVVLGDVRDMDQAVFEPMTIEPIAAGT
jgi:hypothetical protein